MSCSKNNDFVLGGTKNTALFTYLSANPAFRCKDSGSSLQPDGTLALGSSLNIYIVVLSLYSEGGRYPRLIQHNKDSCVTFATQGTRFNRVWHFLFIHSFIFFKSLAFLKLSLFPKNKVSKHQG